MRGTHSLCRVFAPIGIGGMAAVVLEQHVGIGNHRVLMLGFKLSFIIGDELPRIVAPATRILNSPNERIKNNYNRVLEELYDRHEILKKLLQKCPRTFSFKYDLKIYLAGMV